MVTNSSAAVGMHCHGLVELLFGGTHLHGDGEGLDDFRRVGAQHMGAENALAGAVHHQLHQGVLVPAREGVLHGRNLSL